MEILDCGHPESPHSDYTRGYGKLPDGRKHCLDCCLTRELDAMDANGETVGYLSGDGKAITDWPGGKLATVTREYETDAGGFCRGMRITRVWAIDRHGVYWYGRGPGRGMYVRLTRSKDHRAGRR